MKKYILFFTLALSFSNINFFSLDKDKFNNAVLNYNQLKYNDSLTLFLELHKSGYDNFEINYNIGSCYFRLNELGKARFYYERALLFNSLDKELIHNLNVVYSKLGEKDFDQILLPYRFLFFISPLIISIINILVILLIISFIFLIFKVRVKRVFLILIILFSFLSLFLFIFNIIQISEIKSKRFVVTAKESKIYIAPNENETVLLTVNEGYSGKFTGVLSSFIKIKLSDGLTGWLKSSDILTLEKLD